MFDRFSDHARKCMGLARQESTRFSHDYIGPEHILLGLLRERDCVAHVILRSLDASPERIATSVEARIAEGEPQPPLGQLPFTPRAKRVLEYSLEEAIALEDRRILTVHVLLGLLRIEEGVVRDVLAEHGPTLEAVREKAARTEPAGDGAREECVAMTPSLEDVAAALEDVEEHVVLVLRDVRRLRDVVAALDRSRGD